MHCVCISKEGQKLQDRSMCFEQTFYDIPSLILAAIMKIEYSKIFELRGASFIKITKKTDLFLNRATSGSIHVQ